MENKKIGIMLLTLLVSIRLFGQNNIVSNTTELVSAAANEESIFVKDLVTGGMFVHVESGVTADKGVVFPRKSGGFWVRHFDKSKGVNPCWWGAKGDGVNDDLPALNAATNYCQENETIMQFPSGVFRITGQWIIGGKTLSEEDLFSGKLTQASSFDMKQHQIARKSSPIIIRGSVNTCIYGDFNASKLTAIIYYNIQGNGSSNRPSSHLSTHEFSNIGIYAQGHFNGMVPTPPASVNPENKQIGLVMLYCNNSKIDGCNFSGLKYGLVFKTSYFGSLQNCDFELCQTGLYTADYNANLIENIVGNFCKLLADINGSQIVVNNLNSEFCETTLAFKGKNIVLNGVYCENTNLKLANNYQLIFGRSQSDRNYNPKSTTTGVVINAVTLTAGGRDVILLEDDMKQLNINGANINGGIVTKKADHKIISQNMVGGFKVSGPGKQLRKDE